jgi:4-amino-4-deoxy-L-arabinose transferase-like glycosyltransferase
MRQVARDLRFVLPTALALGAGLAAMQPGSFLRGWTGFAALFAAGLLGLAALVRWGGGGRTLAWMTAVALGLRLLAGTTLYVLLPVDGYDEPDDRAGFVFTDAHRRDDQAWDLASSGASLLAAFDRRYYTDQYGGLLALSALTYRVLSPDAHRPLLVLSLAAIAAALGVPFFYRVTRQLWGKNLAFAATWLYCLYPESVITGGAQMREPFLLTFISIALWGFATWLEERSRNSWMGLGIGFAGLVLTSPAIALGLVALLAVWLRIRGEHTRSALALWIGGAVLFLAAFVFLAWSLNSRAEGASSPIGIIASWFREAVGWVVYQLERGSGQVQNVFSKLFPAAQFLFVVAYGITQPLLPPAFLEPTTITWHAIGILRSLGWYIVLPLLAYAPIAVWRREAGVQRRLWAWLVAFSWLWILVAAVRAGGDQWDNPRYRLIFFGIQALAASAAWLSWRADRDAWLPRIVAAEILCLLLFGQWYLARYYLIGIHFPIMVVMSMCIIVVLLILGGGAVWEHRRRPPPAD